MARELTICDLLPRIALRDDATGELQAFCDAIQVVLDSVLAEIDVFGDIWDIDRAPDKSPLLTNFIDIILLDLANPFEFVQGMTTIEKKRIAKLLVLLYRQKGT